ncbi:MAG: DUF4345 family protein [Anaerolineales bacterium]|jgi:hypothetical protein
MALQILRTFIAVATILTGAVSMFWPLKVLGFTGLAVDGGRGITEIRTILGALFVGLGAAALYINKPETYQMLGITYITMGVVRVISIFVDDSPVSSNYISVAAELVFGILLML